MGKGRDVIRWGVLGPGRIAGVFAEGLSELPDAELAAVGSRTAEGAAAFGERFGVPRRHTGYEALAADPDVDIVYVATPHTAHHPAVRLCLEAGKPVLCEKPFTLNADLAEDLVTLARERGLLLMEAMWTRYLPLMGRLRELVTAGAIGEPRLLAADFGFRTDGRQGRLFDPALGGGGLLDVGVYCVSLASMLFGTPDRVVGLAELGPTGVDEQAALVLGHPGGQIAQVASGVRTATPQEATLLGSEGWLRVASPWWRATTMTLHVGDREEQVDGAYPGNGYQFEAAEAMRCLREGLSESPVLPLAETVSVLRTLDTARAQWGLRYPTE